MSIRAKANMDFHAVGVRASRTPLRFSAPGPNNAAAVLKKRVTAPRCSSLPSLRGQLNLKGRVSHLLFHLCSKFWVQRSPPRSLVREETETSLYRTRQTAHGTFAIGYIQPVLSC